MLSSAKKEEIVGVKGDTLILWIIPCSKDLININERELEHIK